MPDLQQNPQVDPTQMSPQEWQQYLHNAIAALHANPRDQEAYQAVADANMALGSYDEAEAASPMERITSGFKGGVRGLGQAAVDIPRGISQTVAHPIQTIESLPNLPGNLANMVTSDNPETVARGIGNIGTLLAPFAKTSRITGAPSVGGAVTRGAMAPVRAAGDLMARPKLRNMLLEEKIKGQQLENAAPKRETNPIVEEKTRLQVEKLKRDLAAGPDAEVVKGRKLTNDLREARLNQQPTVAEGQTLGNKLKNQKLGADQRAPGTGDATLENIELRNQLLRDRINPPNAPGTNGPAGPTTPSPSGAGPVNTGPQVGGAVGGTKGPASPTTPSPKATGPVNTAAGKLGSKLGGKKPKMAKSTVDQTTPTEPTITPAPSKLKGKSKATPFKGKDTGLGQANGIDVTGESPTPKIPDEPTINEMQKGVTSAMRRRANAIEEKIRMGKKPTPDEMSIIDEMRKIHGLDKLDWAQEMEGLE